MHPSIKTFKLYAHNILDARIAGLLWVASYSYHLNIGFWGIKIFLVLWYLKSFVTLYGLCIFLWGIKTLAAQYHNTLLKITCYLIILLAVIATLPLFFPNQLFSSNQQFTFPPISLVCLFASKFILWLFLGMGVLRLHHAFGWTAMFSGLLLIGNQTYKLLQIALMASVIVREPIIAINPIKVLLKASLTETIAHLLLVLLLHKAYRATPLAQEFMKKTKQFE